jgi:predicted DNA-binding protein (MmcQ/YjbR family)
MKTRKEAIKFCLGYPDVSEDYPFHDSDWCVMRHRENRKVFAWIFDRDGRVWINVKCSPDFRYFWRDAFESVVPTYHLNKEHRNSIILDGTIPDKDIGVMIDESYVLTADKKKRTAKRGKT